VSTNATEQISRDFQDTPGGISRKIQDFARVTNTEAKATPATCTDEPSTSGLPVLLLVFVQHFMLQYS